MCLETIFFRLITFLTKVTTDIPLRFYTGRLKKRVKMITSLARSSNTGAAAFFITPFRYLDKTKPCNFAVARKDQCIHVSIPCESFSFGGKYPITEYLMGNLLRNKNFKQSLTLQGCLLFYSSAKYIHLNEVTGKKLNISRNI